MLDAEFEPLMEEVQQENRGEGGKPIELYLVKLLSE